MNSIEKFKSTTVPWNCSRCGHVVDLPDDMAHPGEVVECQNCGLRGVLVNKTYPKKCVVCGNIFHPSKTTATIGGIAQCPHCSTIYKRATRVITKGTAQFSGELQVVKGTGPRKRG